MADPAPTPGRFDWFFWPTHWAGDEKFWREVATRTMAATFAALIIGLPVVIYTAAIGKLDWSIAAPILIGVALVLALSFLYLSILRFVEDFRDLRALRQLVKRPKLADGMSEDEFEQALADYRSRLKSPETAETIASIRQHSFARARALALPAVMSIALVISAPFLADWLGNLQ